MILVKKRIAIFLLSFAIVDMMQQVILMAESLSQVNVFVTEWMKDFTNVDVLFDIAFGHK